MGIIGLGYVGLPLAVASASKYPTTGFDISSDRISELKSGLDKTNEVSQPELEASENLSYTNKAEDLKDCNFYIITVPTPIDDSNQPNLNPLKEASKTVGSLLKAGDIVVYESTVYPGCTEEICVPLLEKSSGLEFNRDFTCGYSPERINPGDKEHRFNTILKVTSGSDSKSADTVDGFYSSLVHAGTFKATSIRVAEAAKVIENSQRDINIAFVNELSLIFGKLGIDTKEVLEAAGTKWNFLKFSPGLVGGHCIGVDPFYLTHKAESVGYHPQIILSGRTINDSMGVEVARKVIKLLGKKGKLSSNGKVLILGITFKENCPDTRNTRVIDIYNELLEYGLDVSVCDPSADKVQVKDEYKIDLIAFDQEHYDAVILAVAHKEFLDFDWNVIRAKTSVIFDVKSTLPKEIVDGRL